MKHLKETRNKFGRFFYQFPKGESGAGVYDRVSSFLESLWKDIEMKRFGMGPEEEDDVNLVIVSHGLAIRIFLMKWFRWMVKQFERLKNPKIFFSGDGVRRRRGRVHLGGPSRR
ncbi:phosphoglycerate mutase-like protein at74h [Phtheirospermum japonicum]|uniref:Phosphoglycerate mutase-like protein at74h n=1 Tax=Phtheirospermum japonicum TaxID=374723 RepID=A0A830D0Z4_9LAMI|nr:phosphoglycerate mutase-like protein at74h [Phtheirospermum japonicum]